MTLVLGAAAYDPKVVTIWDGFKRWLRAAGLDFDYVLYSQYERQVEDLVAGRVDVAWNSPLAWVRSVRLARARGTEVSPVAMRDTDRDLTSVVIVSESSPLAGLADLRGGRIATGAIDSPQGTLIPLELLRREGLEPDVDVTVVRFDVGVGLHGDHVGGERDAVRALLAGEVDAAAILDGNLLTFAQEGLLTPAAVRVIGQTPPYDHCMMAAGPSAGAEELAAFERCLFGMDYADPAVRPLLDLEGMHSWEAPRLVGYAQLEAAVGASGFYDENGNVRAGDYRP